MMTSAVDDDIPRGKPLRSDAILLSDDQVERAIRASQLGQTGDEQWHLYLQTLALEGIQEWFRKRAPDLLLHNSTRGQIQVGHFRVNVVVTDALEAVEVAIPETAITTSEGIAHFYVLVEVLEDMEQVTVGGYLRHNQLVQQTLSITDGWCWLDARLFEGTGDRLLLELQTLDLSAIPLEQPPAVITALQQRVINTGLWLRDQLDQAAQELAWILLPPVAVPSPLRHTHTPDEQLNILVSNLSEQRGIRIPAQTRPAYKVLPGSDRDLYLYVLTWEVLNPNDSPEWSLLAVLAAPSGTTLAANTCLQLWEGSDLLVEQRAEHTTDGGYLYAQVGGLQNERFSIQVGLSNGEVIELPPFGFQQAEER